MMPSPTELHYFLEVSNTLNVSRAAERIGISQPTLSLAIQRLEHTCGTPLLIRTKSGVQLTHAGQKLVTQVRALLHEWEKIHSDISRDEDEIRGRYTIGCHPSVALFSLPLFLQQLLSAHPNLEVKLAHDLSRKITEDVISFKIDFGIVVNPWEHPDLVIRPLWKDDVVLWTSKKPSALQDPFSGEGVLIADTDLIQAQTILKQLARHKIKFKRLVTSSSLEVISSLVASQVGLGILPTRVAKNVLSFDIKPVKESPVFHDRICLVFRADAQHSKANRLLARTIEEQLKPDKA
jgi:LysR family transcriptional regulator, cell division regulator